MAMRHARTPSMRHERGTSAPERVWGKGGVTHPPAAHAFVVVGVLFLTPPPLGRPFSAPRRTAPFASTAKTTLYRQHMTSSATVTARGGGFEGAAHPARAAVQPSGRLASVNCARSSVTEMRAGCLRTSSRRVPAGGGYTDERMTSHPCDQSEPHSWPPPRLNRRIHPHAPPIRPLFRPAGWLNRRVVQCGIATVWR